MKAPIRDTLPNLASRVLEALHDRDSRIVTAESCTAGKLSALLSQAPGAGELLEGGFVTYTKRAKSTLLGVSMDLLQAEGAVCPKVAIAMAEGALRRSPADIAVAITGVAGPGTDEDHNPVGRVCYAVAQSQQATRSVERQYGRESRETIQEMAMADALQEVLRILRELSPADGADPPFSHAN